MDHCSPCRKVQKMEFDNLSGFQLKEVLRTDVDHKRCVIHATDSEEKSAVIIIDKKSFSEENLGDILCEEAKTSLHVQNDIYGNYDIYLPRIFNIAKSTIIWPATEKHVEKYRDQDLFVVKESSEDYKNITLPYIESSQFSIQWIYNLLEHKAESDRIIFEDPDQDTGFILAPDLKWDGKTMENLYVTAICHKHGIKSIRDLTEVHVPLLENILRQSRKAINKKYGVDSSQLVVYFHYQPSYYHLHVHFVHVKFQAPGGGAAKAHLIETVLHNLRFIPNYYQHADLTYVLKANDPLLQNFKEAGKLTVH